LPRIELDQYLRGNDSLVLFDGLDEVVERHRGDAVLRVIAFGREYPRARIIVTSRIPGYHPGSTYPEQFRDAQFQQFTIQDFQNEEVDRFITIWHKEVFQQLSDRNKYESSLRAAIADSAAIRELSANPLLLTLMAVFNRVQNLPRDRWQLYERCAELLLENWDRARDIRDKFGSEQKMRILELVAAAMQKERTGLAGNIITEAKLKEIIQKQLTELGVPEPWSAAGELISLLHVRNFMLAYLGDKQYAFVHRTFLEYFCARDLKYRFEKTTKLTIKKLVNYFSTKWNRDEWQEVLSLLATMIGVEYAVKCISALLEQSGKPGGEKAVFLAARCVQEIRERAKIREVRKQVYLALIPLVTFTLPEAHHSDERAREALRIRGTAVQELARGWKEDQRTETWLKNHACYDTDIFVRTAAAQELARGWKESPDMMSWLKDRAVSDPNASMHMTALGELARGWKNEPEMSAWLKERARRDHNALVRATAIKELARGWREEAGLSEWLKERALRDDSGLARQTAVQELAHRGKKEQGITELLKQRALEDPDWFVRNRALQQLARGWKDESRMREWLQERAIKDDDAKVRQTAVEELGRGWKNHPAVAALFRRLSRDDSSSTGRMIPK
jgi:predicted NACHT family NTPase